MVVFNTEMHVLTFLVALLELVFFFYQIVYYWSRPSDKNRLYYLVLLYLLIQQNLVGGVFPDENIPINIILQNILAFVVSIAMAMYFPYYFYKAFKLTKLKFYAYWGSIVFILVPFILCFLVPYYLTRDLELCRKIVVVVPFLYALSFIYSLASAIKAKNKEDANATSKQDIIGMYVAVILWCTLPIIAFFETNINDFLTPIIHFDNGSQLVEVIVTNSGLLVMTVLFLRQTVRQSRSEYNKLLESEQQLQELNLGLTLKVQERTRELEHANEQRTNTFINLAHETKTPLTLINNYLGEYILKYGEPEEMKIIKSNIEKLTRDIVNFFDVEKIQKGLDIYDNSQITNFSNLLLDNIVLFKQYSSKKNIKMTELIVNEIFVKAAPDSLHRIVNNLIENAIKYTEVNGKIEVFLKCNKDNIVFSVKDNGPGIPPNLHDKIFDPYYQINTEKKNIQGMGMGLSIVKKITGTLNGEIIIISDPQKKPGTEIMVHLPMYQNAITKEEVISEFSNSANLSYFESGQLNLKDEEFDENKHIIMIVEDNIQLLNYMGTKLKEKYNIHYAVSGNEALEKLKTIKQLDLIVSDVMMDDGSGFDFYNGVNSQKRLSHIPFIFLTAKTNVSDKIHGLSLGAIDYISKPFHLDELTNKIDSVLNNLTVQREALIHNAYRTLLHQNAPEPVNGTHQNRFETNCSKFNLTAREREIVHLIAKGQSYKEIANALYISDKTVGKHIQNMFEKVGASNKAELVNKLEYSSLA